MSDEAKQLIDRAVTQREQARTPAEQAAYEAVTARNRVIQAGVKPPASGIYGKPPKR
jgi:hypothetical protein